MEVHGKIRSKRLLSAYTSKTDSALFTGWSWTYLSISPDHNTGEALHSLCYFLSLHFETFYSLLLSPYSRCTLKIIFSSPSEFKILNSLRLIANTHYDTCCLLLMTEAHELIWIYNLFLLSLLKRVDVPKESLFWQTLKNIWRASSLREKRGRAGKGGGEIQMDDMGVIIWGKRKNTYGGFLECFVLWCKMQFRPLSSGTHTSENKNL